MFGATLEQMRERIMQAHHVAICGHVNPDGDCLGSVLALGRALRKLDMRVDTLFSDDKRPVAYEFLPGYGVMLAASEYTGSPDLFIALDTSTKDRLGASLAHLTAAPCSVAIDHHPDHAAYAQLVTVSPESAAVGEVVWELIKLFPIEVDADIATCCYTALITDTGRFSYQNVTRKSFELAGEMVAAGANPELVSQAVYQSKTLGCIKLESLVASRIEAVDGGRVAWTWYGDDDLARLDTSQDSANDLVDIVRGLEGTQAVMLLRQEGGKVRGSLRSKGDANIGAVARILGGGGHDKAAGFTVDGTVSEVAEKVLPMLVAAASKVDS